MSLRLRLLLWQTALLSILIVLFSVGVYTSLSRTLYQEVDSQLEHNITTVTSFVQPGGLFYDRNISNINMANRNSILVFFLCGSSSMVSSGDLKITVRKISDNSVVCTSSNVVAPPDEQVSLNGHISEAVVNDIHLHIFTQKLPGLNINLQVEQSVGELDHALERLKLFMFVGSLLILLFSGILNWFLATRLVQPLQNLTAAATAIGLTRDFSRRVNSPLKTNGDEVGQLAFSFNGMLDRLEVAYQDVQEALLKQQQFVADASHELRTPLTSISGNLELLSRKALPPEEEGPTLADIHSEVARMTRLVQNLLQLARADTGSEIPLTSVALVPLVTNAQRQIAMLNREVKVTLGHLDEVIADGNPDLLRQLLLILGENAAKFTPPGGTITLAVTGPETDISKDASKVKITVSDTGPGIPLEYQSRIFDRFFVLDTARTGESTGLGLAIAKAIVVQHKGNITLESVPGKGTMFQIFLPLYSAVETEPAFGLLTSSPPAKREETVTLKQ